MDERQYRDWVDFTGRMARRVRPSLSGPRRARVAAAAAGAIRAAIREGDFRRIRDWDGPEGAGHAVEDHLSRGPRGGDADLALACVQAGFDVAVAPSQGVVGSDATLGLLRGMYPEGLPGFVERHLAATGVAPSAPDASRVWL